MFTGIVEAAVPVRSTEARGSGLRLVLPSPALEGWRVGLGDSISVSGACLTVAAFLDPPADAGGPDGDPTGSPAGPDLAFDLSRETLERTWFGSLAPGRRVNLERAMLLGARLDGHLVSGHVDGGGSVVAVEDVGDGGREITFEVAPELERYLVDKGSVTLDGISLTVVRPEGRRFRVACIPLTLALTNLGQATPGTPVNVEADLVGKWVERLMAPRAGA